MHAEIHPQPLHFLLTHTYTHPLLLPNSQASVAIRNILPSTERGRREREREPESVCVFRERERERGRESSCVY